MVKRSLLASPATFVFSTRERMTMARKETVHNTARSKPREPRLSAAVLNSNPAVKRTVFLEFIPAFLSAFSPLFITSSCKMMLTSPSDKSDRDGGEPGEVKSGGRG